MYLDSQRLSIELGQDLDSQRMNIELGQDLDSQRMSIELGQARHLYIQQLICPVSYIYTIFPRTWSL